MGEDCLFCKIVKKELKSELVHEDEESIAFKDINPQAPTHLLIVPKKHIEKLSDMTPSDKTTIGHLQWVAKELARQLRLTAFRVVVNNGLGAGQAVFHLHYHLLAGRPFRWPPG